jgi:hypothetical protein
MEPSQNPNEVALRRELRRGAAEINTLVTQKKEGPLSLKYLVLVEQETTLGSYKQRLVNFLENEELDESTKRRIIGTAGHLYKSYSQLNDAYEALLKEGIKIERAGKEDKKPSLGLLVDFLVKDVERTKMEMEMAKRIEDRLSGVEAIAEAEESSSESS